MNILNLTPVNLGNISTNLAHAINSYTNHHCRSVAWNLPPFDFDVDMLWKENESLVQRLINEADILHLNSWYFSKGKLRSILLRGIPLTALHGVTALYKRYNPIAIFQKLPTEDSLAWNYQTQYINRKIDKKKMILHYHGGDLRRLMSGSDKRFINEKGLKALVTVPDLLPQLDCAHWLPIPVPTNEELYKPPQKRDDRVIKIVHAPTGKEEKKTIVLIKVVKELKLKYDVRLMLIENTPFKECLKLKKEGHIMFDNIEFGSYGGSSVEAMCHEQPVLVYLNQVSQEEIQKVSKQVGIAPPLVNVGDPKQPSIEYLNKVIEGKTTNIVTRKDYTSVYNALEQLIVDSNLRKELGKRGRQWAVKVHDERAVVGKLIEIYENITD